MERHVMTTDMDARAVSGAFAAIDGDMTLEEAECIMSFDQRVCDAIRSGDEWALGELLQAAADELLCSGCMGGAL